MSVANIALTVYIGTHNIEKYQLTDAGVTSLITQNVTRMTLEVGDDLLDSDSNPVEISWDDNGLLSLELGSLLSTAGTWLGCPLRVYFGNSDAFVWALFNVTVIAL